MRTFSCFLVLVILSWSLAIPALADQTLRPTIDQFLDQNGHLLPSPQSISPFEASLPFENQVKGMEMLFDPTEYPKKDLPYTSGPSPLNANWSSEFGVAGTSYRVEALTEFNGELIVAGSFSQAGGNVVNAIARWDGSNWYPLGSGVNGFILDLAVYNNELIVGGTFSTAGGVPANNIAKWDGANWSAIGNTNGVVGGLTVWNGSLVAGGGFSQVGGVSTGNVAKWDGTTWSGFGITGGNLSVHCLANYLGELYAGGTFTAIDGVSANRIARWDGTQWQPLSSGMNAGGYTPEVYAMTTHNGDLIAVGPFDTAGGNPANNVARWDGTGWHALGAGLNIGTRAVLSFGTDLIVGGAHTTAGGLPSLAISLWDGTNWSAMAGGMDSRVVALAEYNGNVFAGGWFTTSDGNQTNYVAEWTGATWLPLGGGKGLDSFVYECLEYQGTMVAAGSFSNVGPGIAAWDGFNWSPLGAGSTNGPVYALAEYNGDLIAAGGFTQIGGTVADGIARWDGSQWSPLFVGQGPNRTIYSLLEYNGDLIAGGTLTSIDGIAVGRIARWDGTQWYAMGTMLAGTYTPEVYDMAIYNGNLIAVGPFDTTDGIPTNSVASWDGLSWSALGGGFNIGTRAVIIYNGDLYVGGAFTTADGNPANSIAKWDGTSWSALGSGLNARVEEFAIYNGELIAGGWFTTAGGLPANYIASWNGFTWSALGAGTDNWVEGLATYDQSLYVGGLFSSAGGHPSYFIGRYTMLPVPVEITSTSASWEAGSAVLRWSVADATQASFTVFKEDPHGTRVPVSPNAYFGQTEYEFLDPTAEGPTRYWLDAISRTGEREWFGPILLNDRHSLTPLGISLASNPMRGSTLVSFSTPIEGQVEVMVFNIRGERVAQLARRHQAAGTFQIQWNGRSDTGSLMPQGTYFIQLVTNEGAISRKVSLLH